MNKLILSLCLVLCALEANAKTWTVKSGESIQNTVDKIAPGDTVEVKPGVYHEAIYIDKPKIKFIGLIENGKWPVLEGDGKRNDGVIASGSDFEIRNFHVRNYKGNGITTQGADDVLIKSVMIEKTG